MVDDTAALPVPPSIERVLKQFRVLGREEKMQALLSYAKKLEPLPERTRVVERLMLGLRLDEGLALAEAADVLDVAALDRLVAGGLVEYRDQDGRERIALMPRGRFLGGGVTAELLA